EEVAALPRHLTERVDEPPSGLEVAVRGVPAPALVDGHTRLPAPGRGLGGDELLGRVEVTRAWQPVVHEDVRLESADHVLQLAAPPLLRAPLPAAIEPEQIDGSVAREQLAHLPVHETQ